MVSVSSGSLGTCGDAKIVSLTSQLKNKFYGIKDSSNTLNSVLNEYLDEFAKAEGELANQKAGVFSIPEYDGQMAQIVNDAIIPVLRGEKLSLRELGYLFRTGADWSDYCRSPYWWEDVNGECTARAWDKPCDNARKWAQDWRNAGGETYDLYYEDGVLMNADRVGANDVLCCQYYGKSTAADACGHVIYVGVDSNGKYYISHAGENMRHVVRGGYDSFEDLMSDTSYWDINTLRNEIKKGNVSVLEISGP